MVRQNHATTSVSADAQDCVADTLNAGVTVADHWAVEHG